MATPHDSLFKQVFQQREHAVGLLRHYLPDAVTRRVDWVTLQLVEGSVVDEELSERHADLLYGVELAGRPAFLYLLLEHKSKAEALTPFQMLACMVRIWEKCGHENPGSSLLPPIIPIVVHHSEKGWTVGKNMRDLFDLDDGLRAELGRHLPSLELLVIDLAHESEVTLQQLAASELTRLTLFCLQRARHTDDLLGELRRWASHLRALRRGPGGGRSMEAVFVYIMKMQDLTRAELTRSVAAMAGPDAEATMTSTYDRAVNEGLEKGRTEGQALGRAKGQAEGQADLLLKQLSAFGPVPEDLALRVRQATPEQITAWAMRVLNAKTIDDVFAPE